ncbi:hypothetical protein DUE52_07455 [Larkinella punicea]|uniref:Uncharacterized protein n=1 Tax=Larkinella punicea TaxID=2315727 RepID=A0A368JRU7_9BACT|nr:hypothetical protein DUE52_07455 [Larkinella punicea]
MIVPMNTNNLMLIRALAGLCAGCLLLLMLVRSDATILTDDIVDTIAGFITAMACFVFFMKFSKRTGK